MIVANSYLLFYNKKEKPMIIVHIFIFVVILRGWHYYYNTSNLGHREKDTVCLGSVYPKKSYSTSMLLKPIILVQNKIIWVKVNLGLSLCVTFQNNFFMLIHTCWNIASNTANY